MTIYGPWEPYQIYGEAEKAGLERFMRTAIINYETGFEQLQFPGSVGVFRSSYSLNWLIWGISLFRISYETLEEAKEVIDMHLRENGHVIIDDKEKFTKYKVIL